MLVALPEPIHISRCHTLIQTFSGYFTACDRIPRFTLTCTAVLAIVTVDRTVTVTVALHPD